MRYLNYTVNAGVRPNMIDSIADNDNDDDNNDVLSVREGEIPQLAITAD